MPILHPKNRRHFTDPAASLPHNQPVSSRPRTGACSPRFPQQPTEWASASNPADALLGYPSTSHIFQCNFILNHISFMHDHLCKHTSDLGQIYAEPWADGCHCALGEGCSEQRSRYLVLREPCVFKITRLRFKSCSASPHVWGCRQVSKPGPCYPHL